MKNVLFVLSMLFSILCFSQKKELPIKIDSNIVALKDSIFKNYQDQNHIDYYNKRISDVLKKIYYVIDHEYQDAADRGWFRYSAEPALKNAIEQRDAFIKNNKQQ